MWLQNSHTGRSASSREDDHQSGDGVPCPQSFLTNTFLAFLLDHKAKCNQGRIKLNWLGGGCWILRQRSHGLHSFFIREFQKWTNPAIVISCEQDVVKMIVVCLGEESFKIARMGQKYFIKICEKQAWKWKKKILNCSATVSLLFQSENYELTSLRHQWIQSPVDIRKTIFKQEIIEFKKTLKQGEGDMTHRNKRENDNRSLFRNNESHGAVEQGTAKTYGEPSGQKEKNSHKKGERGKTWDSCPLLEGEGRWRSPQKIVCNPPITWLAPSY